VTQESKIKGGEYTRQFGEIINRGDGAPLPAGGDQFYTVVFPPNTPKPVFDTPYSLDEGIGIRVRITYTDNTGTPYETGFCFSRLASGANLYCKEGNYMK
jgi:hypothetical protein